MLTVDEASIYTALAAGIAISAWHARSAWRHRKESLAQFSEALARFRSGVLLGFLALVPFVMALSAVIFHFALGDRYNHAAPYNWVGAFVGFMLLSLVIAGAGSVLLRLSRPNP